MGRLAAPFAFLIYSLLLFSSAIALDREGDGVNAELVQEPDPCSLKADPGLCYASFPSFYYDAQADKCMEFIYGGCGGNANRFQNEKECQKFRHRCLRKLGKPKRT